MVSGQADVAAAGCGADPSPAASEEEWLGAEGQLHPACQRHDERAVGADSVQTLSVVFLGWRRGLVEVERENVGRSYKYTVVTPTWLRQNHTCTKRRRYAVTDEKSVKKTSVTVQHKAVWRKINRDRAPDCMNTSLAFCLSALFDFGVQFVYAGYLIIIIVRSSTLAPFCMR